jgi:hypothetical protein
MMWARILEIFLGLWLLSSPWIFSHNTWTTDIYCGLAVMLFSCLSFREKARYAYLLNLGVAFWLVGSAFTGPSDPVPKARQNQMVSGLLLFMFSMVPVHASHPPDKWLRYSIFKNKN